MSNTYAYIEILPHGYRWAIVGRNAEPDFLEGGQEAVIAWVSGIDEPVILVVPGEQVVVRQVPYSEKEKRHFTSLLPYEIEEDIVENVDEIHFSVGKISDSVAVIAYLKKAFFLKHWQMFSECDIVVERCIIDFQTLPVEEDSVTLWFSSDGHVLANTESGLGFSVLKHQVPRFLPSLVSITESKKIAIYSNDSENQLPTFLKEISVDNVEVLHYQQPPKKSLSQDLMVDFCCGEYQYRHTLLEGAQGFRSVLVMAVLAVLAFVGVNGYAGLLLQEKNTVIEKKVELLARQVIPRGNINDPVKHLKQKLGESRKPLKKPSQLVYLFAKISPVVAKLNIDVSTINYSDKDKSLRINVKAESFSDIEGLNKAISSEGLDVVLLSSNAVDQQYQARLRVTRGAAQ